MEIVAPFNIQHAYVKSPIGNGHDAYILTKPDKAADLVTAGAFEQRVELSGDDIVSYALDIAGQRISRVFVAAADPGAFVIQVSVFVKAWLNNKLLENGEVMLSRGTRFFGHTYYTMLEIKLPGNAHGKLEVQLKPKAPGQHYLRTLKWFAPHAF